MNKTDYLVSVICNEVLITAKLALTLEKQLSEFEMVTFMANRNAKL